MSSPRDSDRIPANAPLKGLRLFARAVSLIGVFCLFGALPACSSPPPTTNVHAVHAQDVTHPGVIKVTTDDEQKVLDKMWELPEGEDTKVGALTVNPSAIYRAASARNCRDLTLQKKGAKLESRLACTRHYADPKESKEEAPAEKWVFVPTVFVAAEADEAEGEKDKP